MCRKKKKELESNIAETPKTSIEKNRLSTKFKVYFLIWNIFSIALYSAYTLYMTYKLAQSSFLSKIIIFLLLAYVVAFVLLLLFGLTNKKKLNMHLKNFKSATKFLKYSTQIINVTLSIITAINIFFVSGTLNFSTILVGIFSIILTLIFIIFEIASIIIRKHIDVIKRNILEIREKPEKKPDRSVDN